MKRKRKATIIEIKPGYVTAKDECGEYHNFMTGSINQVQNTVIGDEGFVEYVGTTRMSLWYWRSK